MACKINSFSLNKPLPLRFLHRIDTLPFSEVLHRGFNIVLRWLNNGLLSFPQNVHLEVTNHCNLACPMCPFSHQVRPKGFMDFNLFKEVIQQCQGRRVLDRVALMGLGEPFLHPELIQMSQYAKARGIFHVFTSTNATLLGEKEAEALVTGSGFDLLAISLDAASSETYERIRRGADFQKAIANIMAFLKIRRAFKKRKPHLTLQFLIMQENYLEKDIFIKFWKNKLEHQDTIMLRDVDTFGGQVPDHRLNSQVPRIKRRPCLQLWKDLIISWNGDVSVCCKDVNYFLKVGNIQESSLADIWSNDQWKRLRLSHKEGRWDKIEPCAHCSEWG